MDRISGVPDPAGGNGAFGGANSNTTGYGSNTTSGSMMEMTNQSAEKDPNANPFGFNPNKHLSRNYTKNGAPMNKDDELKAASKGLAGIFSAMSDNNIGGGSPDKASRVSPERRDNLKSLGGLFADEEKKKGGFCRSCLGCLCSCLMFVNRNTSFKVKVILVIIVMLFFGWIWTNLAKLFGFLDFLSGSNKSPTSTSDGSFNGNDADNLPSTAAADPNNITRSNINSDNATPLSSTEPNANFGADPNAPSFAPRTEVSDSPSSAGQVIASTNVNVNNLGAAAVSNSNNVNNLNLAAPKKISKGRVNQNNLNLNMDTTTNQNTDLVKSMEERIKELEAKLATAKADTGDGVVRRENPNKKVPGDTDSEEEDANSGGGGGNQVQQKVAQTVPSVVESSVVAGAKIEAKSNMGSTGGNVVNGNLISAKSTSMTNNLNGDQVQISNPTQVQVDDSTENGSTASAGSTNVISATVHYENNKPELDQNLNSLNSQSGATVVVAESNRKLEETPPEQETQKANVATSAVTDLNAGVSTSQQVQSVQTQAVGEIQTGAVHQENGNIGLNGNLGQTVTQTVTENSSNVVQKAAVTESKVSMEENSKPQTEPGLDATQPAAAIKSDMNGPEGSGNQVTSGVPVEKSSVTESSVPIQKEDIIVEESATSSSNEKTEKTVTAEDNLANKNSEKIEAPDPNVIMAHTNSGNIESMSSNEQRQTSDTNVVKASVYTGNQQDSRHNSGDSSSSFMQGLD